MRSLLTSPAGTFHFTDLIAEAGTRRGRIALQNLLSEYRLRRDQLDPHQQRTRDIAAARVRHALQAASAPAQSPTTPAGGRAA